MFTAPQLANMLRQLEKLARRDAEQTINSESKRWYRGLEAGYQTGAQWIEEHLCPTDSQKERGAA